MQTKIDYALIIHFRVESRLEQFRAAVNENKIGANVYR